MNSESINQSLSNITDSIDTYKNYPIPKVTYFDLNPIYKDRILLHELTKVLIDKIRSLKYQNHHALTASFDYIACIESRGFILGSILAHAFNKGIILLRSKPGRLPGNTTMVEHTLEYGEAQMEVQNGTGRVLIFDDVLATGGTSQAAQELLTKSGYDPVYALFLLELSYCKPNLNNVEYTSIITFDKDPYAPVKKKTKTKAKPKSKAKPKAKKKSKAKPPIVAISDEE